MAVNYFVRDVYYSINENSNQSMAWVTTRPITRLCTAWYMVWVTADMAHNSSLNDVASWHGSGRPLLCATRGHLIRMRFLK